MKSRSLPMDGPSSHNVRMKLLGANGDSLELEIRGYQFEDTDSLVDDTYDPNWLRVVVRASSAGRSWQSTAPCLLTWEAGELADWMDAVASGKPADSLLEFLEPNLSFEYRPAEGGQAIIRVAFEQESRPPWCPVAGPPHRDCWIALEADAEELRRWSHDLRNQLIKFPRR